MVQVKFPYSTRILLQFKEVLRVSWGDRAIRRIEKRGRPLAKKGLHRLPARAEIGAGTGDHGMVLPLKGPAGVQEAVTLFDLPSFPAGLLVCCYEFGA